MSALVATSWFAALPIDIAAATKPNIVIFYIDDSDPMDGRLWNDPTLTPNIYNLFVAHGIHFTNAFGETPLCCPSRATLFTGLHTQNHGVLINDGTLFNPGETVAKELQKSGYHTTIVGKYLNKVFKYSSEDWFNHVVGWDDMDVFVNDQTLAPERWYYNFDVRQRNGTVTHYDTTHSTRFVTEDAVARIHEAPADQPIFALLSTFDTHQPNIPMPEFATDPRCSSMPPWRPPNYDEDVSDKPTYVKKHAINQDPAGFDLVTLCREMLDIDWMVSQVVNELVAEGRFDNTAFVFTTDNGMTWGEHRLPDNKHTPYATPVPLYMSWKNGWGTTPRSIEEFVSDIDLAPTFCALGKCTLGPYPGGQTQPDGLSLLPVINGAVNGTPTHLGRDAILQSNFEVPWWGLRTTTENSLGLWTYTEWANGDVELYDMTNDPWEMNNLAQEPAFASVRSALRRRLAQLKVEGQPSVSMGSVTIIQNSSPNSARDFQFTGSFGTFDLDDDSNNALPRKRLFSGLAAGDYVITQDKEVGWSLSSIACAGADVDVASRTAVIHVYDGVALKCTFNTVLRRPDTSIALQATGVFKGTDFYSPTAVKRQTQSVTGVANNSEHDYLINVQNDGKLDDAFALVASVTSAPTITATFWSGGTDVTEDVMAGTYHTPVLAPTSSVTLDLHVSVGAEAHSGDTSIVIVEAVSLADGSAVDVVRAITGR